MIPPSDNEADEENGSHNNDEHNDDFESGSTVVVDEGSSSGDFEGFLPMTYQLLEYPARLEKLQLKMSELQALNNTLGNSNSRLSTRIKETKKEHELLSRNNDILLESLGEKEREVNEMKTKCDRLERENEELSRRYAASERKRVEITADASIAINQATIVSEGCKAVTAELQ